MASAPSWVTRTGRAARLLTGVILACGCACAHTAGSRAAETAQVRAAITAGNAEFAQALQRGDARAMAAVYSEDGEIIPPGQRGTISGRPEIEAYQAKRLQGRRYLDVVITTEELGFSGDLAWERGASRVELQQGGGAPVTLTGRYLAVWKRESDGRWRIRAELPVSDPVPPAP